MMRSVAAAAEMIIRWKCKTKKEAVLQSFIESRICNSATGSLTTICAHPVNRQTCEWVPEMKWTEMHWMIQLRAHKNFDFHVSISLYENSCTESTQNPIRYNNFSGKVNFRARKSVVFREGREKIKHWLLRKQFSRSILDNVNVSYLSDLTILVFLLTFVMILFNNNFHFACSENLQQCFNCHGKNKRFAMVFFLLP